MIRGDDYAHLDEYELAVEHLLLCAEHALREAQELRAHGYEPVQVCGLPQLLWRSPDGVTYTAYWALVEIGEYEPIPEKKGDL